MNPDTQQAENRRTVPHNLKTACDETGMRQMSGQQQDHMKGAAETSKANKRIDAMTRAAVRPGMRNKTGAGSRLGPETSANTLRQGCLSRFCLGLYICNE